MWRITTALRERRGSKASLAADGAVVEPLRSHNGNENNSVGSSANTRPPDQRGDEHVTNRTTRSVSMSQLSARTDDSDTPRSSDSVGRSGVGSQSPSPRPNYTVVAPPRRAKTRTPPPLAVMPTLNVVCHSRSADDDDDDDDTFDGIVTPHSPRPTPDGVQPPRIAPGGNGTNTHDGSRSPRMGMTFIRRFGARSPRPDYLGHDSNTELTSESLGETPKQSPRDTRPTLPNARPTSPHARPTSPSALARTPSDPWSGTYEQITERVESIEFDPSISLAVLAAAKAYAAATTAASNTSASAAASNTSASTVSVTTPRDGRSATAPFPCGVAAWRWATPFGTDDDIFENNDYARRGCQRCAMKRHGYTTLYGAPCVQCSSDLASSVSISPSPSARARNTPPTSSTPTLLFCGTTPPATTVCGSSPLAPCDDTSVPMPVTTGGSWIRAQQRRASVAYAPPVARLGPDEI